MPLINRRNFFKLLAGLGLAAFGTGAYAVGVEPLLRLQTTRYRIHPAGWPDDLNLRLVVLADIHACEPWMPVDRIEAICAHANTLGGDAILLLGDYVAGTNLVRRYVDAKDWGPALSRLKAPLGVHAVLGNHDWWEDRTAQRKGAGPTIAHRALSSAGIPVYDNQAVPLQKDGHPFWIAGLADQLALLPGRRYGRSRFTSLADIGKMLSVVTDDAPIILMAHEPDIFPQIPKRIALTVSGHTHGGQIRFFGYSPHVPSRFGARYAYGHIVEDDRHLVVSGGLGCSIAPVRFGVPPEIVVIDVNAPPIG